MWAVFKTRCGCQRGMEVPDDVRPYYDLPLRDLMPAVTFDAPVPMFIATRRFKLAGLRASGPYGERTAVYLEQA